MRLIVITLSTALALAVACDAQDTTDAEPPVTGSPTTATEGPTTTSTTTATSTTTPATTAAPTSTTSPEETVDLGARCESPEGYSIGYPEAWSTNPGEVVAECGQFDPEPFQVPAGTDERVAAITAYIDPVPFAEVAAPDEQRDAQRAATAIDGLQAVRLQYETQEDALWPAGTPVTVYAVDVGTEDQQSTLLIDTIGLSQFDYEENQVVLDRMARSLDVETAQVSGDPQVVARYEGGGGGFSVVGETNGEQACLRIPPDGEEVCTDLPAPDQLHTIQLEDLQPVLAGVTGEQVFAVTAHLQDGGTSTVLPAPIGDADVGGFSFAVGLSEIERFVLTDIRGNQLRTIEPGG